MTRPNCQYCYKPLVLIGKTRKNGKDSFQDWETRRFHKKCLPLAKGRCHNCNEYKVLEYLNYDLKRFCDKKCAYTHEDMVEQTKNNLKQYFSDITFL